MVKELKLNLTMDYLIYIPLLMIYGCFYYVKCETHIDATAPVNPVEEGGILSIHCEVQNSDPSDQVVLYRTHNGITTTLSYGEGVSHGVDDRVFLAVRQQMDGSTVYFLSIIDVTRYESGDYFCKVINVANSSPSPPVSSISVQVMYFPSDIDPVCSPKEPPNVRIGDIVTLNCSSEKAIPVAGMTWTRTNDDTVLDTTSPIIGDSRIYSVLRFKVRSSDNKAIFVCEISSKAFPGQKQTCHIGPLVVVDAKDTDKAQLDFEPIIPEIVVPENPPQIPQYEEGEDYFSDVSLKCNDACSSGTSLLFWIIATCMAGILAFTFLIISIFLFVKFIRLPSTAEEPYMASRQVNNPTHKVYNELEHRKLEQQSMYMALDKARKAELHSSHYPTCES